MIIIAYIGGAFMWAVLSDFDGTVAERDLAELALAEFAQPNWSRFNRLLAEGKIDVEECVARQYKMIRANSRGEIIKYLKQFTTIRPGLEDLLVQCRTQEVPFAVVSAGLDFAIKSAFRTWGISMPRLICPHTYGSPSKGFRLVFPERKFADSRDFKEDSVLNYKELGYRVLYVGDGAGDANAAESADKVFTIKSSTLDRTCQARKIPHTTTNSFIPVTKFLSTSR